MKLKIKHIGLYLLIATLFSTVLALSLQVDMTFTIPLYIISVILIFIDDKYIDKFIKEMTPRAIPIDKDKD
jgi:hypothetical protein